MRVLYLNCAETNRPWGAECAVGNELRRRGHLVVDLDYRRERPRLHRLFADGLEALEEPDVVFLQRGDGFPPEILEAIEAPIVYWASEVWWKEQHNPLLERLDLFGHVWVHDGVTKRILESRSSAALPGVTVLPNGYDAGLFQPQCGPATREILFYGNISPRRKRILERLRGLPIERVSNVYGENLVRAIGESKIVLNLHYGEAADLESRVLETLGVGCCLVTEPLAAEATALGFRDGEHFAVGGTVEELKVILERLLSHDVERDGLAKSGHEAAAAGHTWKHRCDEIEARLLEQSHVH